MRWHKLNQEQVSSIVVNYEKGYTLSRLAHDFLVHRDTIRYWLTKNEVYVKWAYKPIRNIRQIHTFMRKKRLMLNPRLSKKFMAEGAKNYADYIQESKLKPDEKEMIIGHFNRFKNGETTSSYNSLF